MPFRPFDHGQTTPAVENRCEQARRLGRNMHHDTDGSVEVLRELRARFDRGEIKQEDRDGRRYLLRVRPYRTTENKIEGAVMVMIDLDQLGR